MVQQFSLSLLLFSSVCAISNAALIEYYRWKQIAFADLPGAAGVPQNGDIIFPGGQDSADYIAANNVPMGANQYRGRMFITVPRRRVGIPATLAYIDMNNEARNNRSPKLRGYPDYKTNTIPQGLQPNPDRLISVYRTRVDECHRLWFIDTGLLEYPDNRTQVQRPSIWVMDLATNQRLHRFEIPETIVLEGNGLASITVDVDPNNCNDAYAYIPDLANYYLAVFSLRENRIWQFRHNYFNFDPLNGDFNIGGVQFQWNDGIFSVTLGERNSEGFRTADFHPMAGLASFTVSTRVLRNETAAQRSTHGNDFKYLGQRGPNRQSTMHEYHSPTGLLLYAEVGRNAVGCWNTATSFSPENHGTVAKNDRKMIYPSDLNLDEYSNVWVMTNTLPRFIYAELNENEYNFRVWGNSIQNAVKDTKCQSTKTENRFSEQENMFTFESADEAEGAASE